MYLHTFGGSALIHLLAGYPRLVLMFGLAGTVALTGTPHGPGRFGGAGQYLAEVDARNESTLASAAAEARARRLASDMLETYRPDAIEAAVANTLRECGPGCTDLATPIIIHDPELLRRVLVLYQLNRAATAERNAKADAGSLAIESAQQ